MCREAYNTHREAGETFCAISWWAIFTLRVEKAAVIIT